jgi:preprotein translocase subunit SecE
MWSSCKAARGFCPDVDTTCPGTAVAGLVPRQKEGIVTETSAKRGSDRADRASGGNPVSRFFGALSLFVRQILDELRKVVRPTGPELVRYTTVVVVFVVIMMAVVSGLDFGLSKLIAWVFTGTTF